MARSAVPQQAIGCVPGQCFRASREGVFSLDGRVFALSSAAGVELTRQHSELLGATESPHKQIEPGFVTRPSAPVRKH